MLPTRARVPLLAKTNPSSNDADTLTLWVYDAIGRDPWDGSGVAAEDVAPLLQANRGRPVHMRINSPGGDVFDARAIVTALRAHDAPVTAQIDGIAASAASYIATAASDLRIADGAFLMIHRAWSFAFGNAEDLIELAALLEKVDGTIADDYARKSGMTRDEAFALMSAETWFTADEAIAAKLADGKVEGVDVEASTTWDVAAFTNAPAELRATVERVRARLVASGNANVDFVSELIGRAFTENDAQSFDYSRARAIAASLNV